MSLMQMPLSRKFVRALADQQAGLVQGMGIIRDVVVVGADTSSVFGHNAESYFSDISSGEYDQCFDDFEEAFLLDANRLLLLNDFSLAAEPEIRLCDLNFGSDFLEDKPQCELLVLSSLLYCPESPSNIGSASMQSRYVAHDNKWMDAFRDSQAKAILFMRHGANLYQGDGRIVRFIVEEGRYESLYRYSGQYPNQSFPGYFGVNQNKYAEFFMRKDLL